MAKYTITLTKQAEKQLDKLEDNIAKPILKAIANLADNPRPHGYLKLKGRNGCRIRVGNYRIIYEIFDGILNIDVITIGNKKGIMNS
ncbi:MAG: type II toxin-antitoxin system RelE/ParE family toxin [Chitinophagaceae bacterium]|nr:type II toxin-antitoxin system RelE/ParE family toxin [Chitinophagaceae bacterium]